MLAHRRRQRQGETVALGRMQGAHVGETRVGLERQAFEGLPEGKARLCRVADQRDEDVPWASTAAATTPHALVQCLRERWGWALERGGPGAARRGAGVDAGKRFLCAFSRVVAAVTR